MEISKLLDFTSDVGECLLSSGAETGRVEDTLTRIIRHFYSGHSEILVVLTGFFVNIGAYTETVRVRRRTINLDRIAKINKLSRDIVGNRMDFDGAVARLEEIKKCRPYPAWIKTPAVAVSCGFFTLLSDGSWADAFNSFIVGAIMNMIINILQSRDTANFIVTFLGGVIIAALTVLIYYVGLGSSVNAMITGAIMPLVPGLAITNALRDIIGGDYLSGGARLFDAVVVAAALAAGAGAVMYLFGYMSGGILK